MKKLEVCIAILADNVLIEIGVDFRPGEWFCTTATVKEYWVKGARFLTVYVKFIVFPSSFHVLPLWVFLK